MTKRIGALLTVLALAVALIAFPAGAYASYTAFSCCSNGKPLNVRQGPGKDYPAVGSIEYGTALVVDHDLGNGWSEIVWGQYRAYVMTSLITTKNPGPYRPGGITPTPAPAPAPSGGGSGLNSIFRQARFVTPYLVTLRGTRGSGSVNVRWAPSLDSTLIQTYAYGSTMQVIAELGEWLQVVDPVTGITGFVMRIFAFR